MKLKVKKENLVNLDAQRLDQVHGAKPAGSHYAPCLNDPTGWCNSFPPSNTSNCGMI